jgi:hypothetical protein
MHELVAGSVRRAARRSCRSNCSTRASGASSLPPVSAMPRFPPIHAAALRSAGEPSLAAPIVSRLDPARRSVRQSPDTPWPPGSARSARGSHSPAERRRSPPPDSRPAAWPAPARPRPPARYPDSPTSGTSVRSASQNSRLLNARRSSLAHIRVCRFRKRHKPGNSAPRPRRAG